DLSVHSVTDLSYVVHPDSLTLFFFFFYCYGAPRDLLSFPTRRSSDLGRVFPSRTTSPDARPSRPKMAWAISLRPEPTRPAKPRIDRKSTRLNSSHVEISYAVFCLKKKNKRTLRAEVGADLRRGGGGGR